MTLSPIVNQPPGTSVCAPGGWRPADRIRCIWNTSVEMRPNAQWKADRAYSVAEGPR